MECSLRAQDCTNSIKDRMNVELSSPLRLFGDFYPWWAVGFSGPWGRRSCGDGTLWIWSPPTPSLNGAILGGKFSQISQVMFVPDAGCLKLPDSLFLSEHTVQWLRQRCYFGVQCLRGVLHVGSGWETRFCRGRPQLQFYALIPWNFFSVSTRNRTISTSKGKRGNQ